MTYYFEPYKFAELLQKIMIEIVKHIPYIGNASQIREILISQDRIMIRYVDEISQIVKLPK